MSVDFAPRYRFTVDEFHRMGDVGIFSEDDRVELINGGDRTDGTDRASPCGLRTEAGSLAAASVG
jgi:hypothetical protein